MFYILVFNRHNNIGVERVEKVEASNIVEARQKVDDKIDTITYTTIIYSEEEYKGLLRKLHVAESKMDTVSE